MFQLAQSWPVYFSAAGSTATVAATIAATTIALRYGRRATAQVEAAVTVAAGLVVLSARPSIQASGVFRLDLDQESGSFIEVAEVWSTADGLAHGRTWRSPTVFGPSFVEPGETLSTTVLFDLDPLDVRLLGWRVVLEVSATRSFGSTSTWSWDDRIFVPAPTSVG